MLTSKFNNKKKKMLIALHTKHSKKVSVKRPKTNC